MYDERKEKFSFKNFFLTLLLVLLFVFLMLWLFPTRSYIDKKLNDNETVFDLDRLSVLYDEIFANNVARMKDAAIGYFTDERLPQKVGQSKKLTLQEMYDLHLVLKMKDKNGNPCDTTKSYVEMTKFTEEYRLKVNLSCGDQEDYIIVYLGCYTYCSGGICEKTSPIPSDKTKDEEQKYDPKPEKYSCRVVNGKYYDKEGNVVSKIEYDKSCSTAPEPENYSCRVVNGKYYDKEGNVVSKAEYDKSCSTAPEKYSCKVVNGKYYDKDGNVVSKAEYDKSCGTTPPPIVKKYMYEYKLETKDKTTCTAWSNWQKTPVTATDDIKVETKTEKEITNYKTVKVQTGTKVETITKQVTEKYIKSYTTELVVVDTKKVDTGKTTTKQVTEKVAVGTVEKFESIGSGTVVPKDTSVYKYKNVTADKVPTCSYCEDETRYTWEVWKVETVYDVVTKTITVPVYKTVNVYEERPVPVYGYRTVEKKEKVSTPIYEERKIPEYGNIKYYRYKNCTTVKGKTDIKWSYSKLDTGLIGKGYKLTGNVKEV